MKKVLFLIALAAAQTVGAQQLANTTFDGTWENCYPWEKGAKVTKAYGTQPSGWCVANVAGMSGLGATTVAAEGTGRSGSGKSVVLTNTPNPLSGSQIVPGYMTLGTTWATAKATFSGSVTAGTADGGAFGGIPFTYHPDAIRLYYKRAHKVKSTSVANETEKASVIAYSWKGTWTQKDVPSNTSMANPTKVDMTDRDRNVLFNATGTVGGAISSTSDAELIASIEYYIEGNASEWTELVIPFTYKTSSTPEKFNIIIAADDYFADRSNIGGYNQLTVDDVELLYYSEIASCTYDGSTITFTDDNATVDEFYDADKLNIMSNGRGATIETNMNETTQMLTITIKGEDISENSSNYHTYNIQFKTEEAPQVLSSKTYSEDLYVTMGEETTDKQVADVLVETLENGNINFVLKNFVLSGAIPVGNIAVNNITVAADHSFTFNGGIAIAPGDDPEIDSWMGPGITEACEGSVPLDLNGQFIGENHVVVYISIDIADFVGYPVEVHLGYARLESGAMTVFADAQYGTFCAPFAVEIPEGVKAYTVPSVTGGVLDLNELTGTIPANTPVVLYSELEEGYSSPDLFGVVEEGTPSVGLLTGVYEEGLVPVGSYVLQLKYLDDEGESYKVGFYKVIEDAQPYSLANRCYLTVPASGGIKEAFFFNEDDATGIKAMVNGQKSMDNGIYNLAGQRMSKMQKGVNIVNGKKILY